MLILLLSILLASSPTSKNLKNRRIPEYTATFLRQSNWSGGDAVYSVQLSPGKILWLFGDSFIGEIKNNRRIDYELINNCAAIQTGKNPNSAEVKFYYKKEDGKPVALIKPKDHQGWFWLYDGIRTDESLYIFLVQIDRIDKDSKSVFNFKMIDTKLAIIKNPDENPGLWKIKQVKIPWGRFTEQGEKFLGSAIMKHENYIYIYGIEEVKAETAKIKYMIVARTPSDRLEDFSRWRFFSNGKWVDDFSKVQRLFGGIANEYSVNYMPDVGKFVVVYSQGGSSRNIYARFSPTPHGPWSRPVTIYRCPETDKNSRILWYAAKAHPEISTGPGRLVVSYVTNSMRFEDLEEDASIYLPRFIEIELNPEFLPEPETSSP